MTAKATKTQWDRLQHWFLNKKVGVAIAVLLAVLGAFGKFKDFVEKVRPAKISTLQLVALSEKGSLEPLDGHPSSLTMAGENVYAGGFKVRLRLANDKQSKHTITVESLSLVIDSYADRVESPPTYQIEPVQTSPQGSALPNRFLVAVRGTNVAQASWIPPEVGAMPSIVKDNRNLFATEPPRVFKLRADSDDSEDFLGTIVMDEPGSYRVHFNVRYVVNGKVCDRETERIPVFAQ